ncbi:hypothetical protein OR221_1897 [Microbacterium laevaniformans OR221]|nr:hypothetical protein OR221_1897 [Microbacterium laevaniformans OR221]
MGSFAQPIPLGIFAAATGVVSFALYLVARRASYLYGACVSAFVLVLSGTRSAVLAMLVATAYILLRSFRMSRLPLYALVTIAILGFVIAIDLPSALGLGGIQSTASYTHRAATIMSIGEALSEPFGSVFFGHGYENVVGLFASGTIGGTDQITVPDNEYFRTFLGAGFVGFALLLGSVIRSLRHAAASSGALVVVVAISLFTFDGLGWNSVATLFYFALGAAAASSSRLAVRRSGGLVGSKSVDALIVTGDATQPSRRQGLC